MLKTDKGHFWLTFKNGYTISVLYNGVFATSRFVECNDSVKGYVSVDELAEIICKVKNYKDDKNGRIDIKKDKRNLLRMVINNDKKRNISKNKKS